MRRVRCARRDGGAGARPADPPRLDAGRRARRRRGFRHRRARRRRVRPQRSVFRRQPSARRQRGAAGLRRRAAARLRLPARPLARRRLRNSRQLRGGDGHLWRGPAPAAAAADQPRHAQRRLGEADPGERPHARRAQGRSRCTARRDLAGDRAAQDAGAPLRQRRARRLHGRGHGLFRAADAGGLARAAGRGGDVRGFLRRRRHPRRCSRQRCAVPHPPRGDQDARPADRRFRRQRPPGEGADERAALGHRVRRLLRAEDRDRPQQPDSAQLRLLARDRGRGRPRARW